jgi:two-component system response regulator ChvI
MQAQNTKERSSLDQKTASVLLIDDEADILYILKRSLGMAGIKSYGFTNPVLAIEHFRKNPDSYDLVISDIRMPGKNGFEVARAIKAINPDVKVALMTAFEMHKDEVEKVLPSLNVELITKPVKPEAFVRLVNGLCHYAAQL